MQLRPTREIGDQQYPTPAEHQLQRRDFLHLLSGVALGVATGSLLTQAGPTSSKQPSGKETLAKQVQVLAAKLGNDDFRARRQATATLIAIGKGNGKDNAADAKMKALVLATMEPLKQSKDPEVSQRAKTIITALTPKPKPPTPPRALEDLIQVKGGR